MPRRRPVCRASNTTGTMSPSMGALTARRHLLLHETSAFAQPTGSAGASRPYGENMQVRTHWAMWTVRLRHGHCLSV